MSNSFLNDFQRDAKSVEQRDVEVPEGVKAGWRNFKRRE
jgi:hypothetical protein